MKLFRRKLSKLIADKSVNFISHFAHNINQELFAVTASTDTVNKITGASTWENPNECADEINERCERINAYVLSAGENNTLTPEDIKFYDSTKELPLDELLELTGLEFCED